MSLQKQPYWRKVGQSGHTVDEKVQFCRFSNLNFGGNEFQVIRDAASFEIQVTQLLFYISSSNKGLHVVRINRLPVCATRGRSYQTFLSSFYKFWRQARVFVPGKLFQPIPANTLALVPKFLNYGQKSLIALGPGDVLKLLYIEKSQNL